MKKRAARQATPQDATPEERILEVVRAIPRGKVATYGQVAELAGIPRGHRIAARTMRNASGVPWQRVLGKKDPRRAQINIQDPEHAARQRQLLSREGVHVSEDGTISLREHGWLPT